MIEIKYGYNDRTQTAGSYTYFSLEDIIADIDKHIEWMTSNMLLSNETAGLFFNEAIDRLRVGKDGIVFTTGEYWRYMFTSPVRINRFELIDKALKITDSIEVLQHLVECIGLEKYDFNWNQSASNCWREVTREAEKHQKLSRLDKLLDYIDPGKGTK